MTRKVPTAWDGNTLKGADAVAYSSVAVAYNAAGTAFSSITTALADDGKLPEAWTPVAKTANAWKVNPLALTLLYLFDSASHSYDSSVDSYDGIVTGQDFADQKTPTAWSEY